MSRDRGRTFAEQRHQARAVAMQVMFEADFSGKPLDEILERRVAEEVLGDEAASYAQDLVLGAWEHRDEHDEMIARAAPSWPLRQMPGVDRNILRLALYEMRYGKGVPMKAAINEAVELAKEFGSDASSRFVNGVLGTVAAERVAPEQRPVAQGEE